MKLIDRVSNLVGLGTARSKPAPELLLLTDGLMVTTTQAIAWYELATSNTDQATADDVDDELDRVIASVAPLLEGRECHLKVVWGRVDGGQYLDQLNHEPTTWDDRRADWLDDYDVPDRHLLLGVVVDANRQEDGKAIVRQQAGAALGLPTGKVSEREKNWLHGQARELGRALNNTPWVVKLAEVETLAWMVSREMHRGTTLPRGGTITGAGLATLTSGRLMPYTNHLRALDDTGQPMRHIAVLALADLPQEIETPGPQEWLRTLAAIHRTTADGDPVAVVVDASVRFTVLTTAEASRSVERVRSLAKEQRQSASKHSAGETFDEIQETEDEMNAMRRDLKRGGLRLIESHSRIVVNEPTLEDLNASVQAVVTHFSNIGIKAYLAIDEQRELWLETLPGDSLRVSDLGHVTDATAFFGAWWWGGSQVGEGVGAPQVGYFTGSTPGIYRHSLVSGAARGDTTTSVFIGRSGRGKTTHLLLEELDAVISHGAWCNHISVKGDDLAAVDVARAHGVNAGVRVLGTANRGSCDLFRSMAIDEAKLPVLRSIEIVTPPHLQRVTATIALDVIGEEAETSAPSTAGVIERLRRHPDPEAQSLGNLLFNLGQTPLGAPLFGPPDGEEALTTEPGLWMIKLPQLNLPAATTTQDSWDQTQRLSVAVIRALAYHSLSVASRPDLREMPKLIAIPEVHRIINTTDGADFIDQVCRIGRAQGTNMAIDTQDATSIERVTGIMEQINTAVVYQLLSDAEQDAAARILGMQPGPESRQTIRGLGIADDPEQVRHGHCIIRDHIQRVGTVQIVIPDEDTRRALNTDPNAQRLRDEHATALGESETATEPAEMATTAATNGYRGDGYTYEESA